MQRRFQDRPGSYSQCLSDVMATRRLTKSAIECQWRSLRCPGTVPITIILVVANLLAWVLTHQPTTSLEASARKW
jgi:hypothetical protein